jgi:hypothetical protein
VASHSRPKTTATTTNTPTLPVVTNPTIFNHATTKLPNVFSHKDNNKLSAPSFDLIPIPMATIKTETNRRDHRKTIRARSDPLQILHDHHSTTRINVDHHHPPRGHPTSLNETIDHLSDRRPVPINVHLLTDPTTTIRATLPMPLQSSAITADASATMRATAQTPDPPKTIAPPTLKDHPIMKTLLPATNNAPTSSLTLAKIHKINQDTTTKPSQLHPLTTLMVTQPTSLGPILTYLR